MVQKYETKYLITEFVFLNELFPYRYIKSYKSPILQFTWKSYSLKYNFHFSPHGYTNKSVRKYFFENCTNNKM